MTSGHDDALYRMVSADQIAGSNPVAERVAVGDGPTNGVKLKHSGLWGDNVIP